MQAIKSTYIDSYKVTICKTGNEYILVLDNGEAKIYKDELTLEGANFLLFQYIKDGKQISENF